MAGVVFVTGLGAKPTRSGTKVLGLLSILVTFHVVFIAFLAVTAHPLREWYWPYWVLWFIMAMVWWQVLTPLIARWPKTAFVLSCAAALLIGFAEPAGNWFAYQRAAAFLPFYVAGMVWGRRLLDFVHARSLAQKCGLITAFALGVTALCLADLEPHWFFQNWTYEQLGAPASAGPILRAAVLSIGGLGTLAVLALAGLRASRLSWLGERTRPVYLFHVFAVLAYDWLMLPHIGDARGSVLLAGSLVGGVILAYFFASPPFVYAASLVRNTAGRLPAVLPHRSAVDRFTDVQGSFERSTDVASARGDRQIGSTGDVR
jgi:hypothetical protein